MTDKNDSIEFLMACRTGNEGRAELALGPDHERVEGVEKRSAEIGDGGDGVRKGRDPRRILHQAIDERREGIDHPRRDRREWIQRDLHCLAGPWHHLSVGVGPVARPTVVARDGVVHVGEGESRGAEHRDDVLKVEHRAEDAQGVVAPTGIRFRAPDVHGQLRREDRRQGVAQGHGQRRDRHQDVDQRFVPRHIAGVGTQHVGRLNDPPVPRVGEVGGQSNDAGLVQTDVVEIGGETELVVVAQGDRPVAQRDELVGGILMMSSMRFGRMLATEAVNRGARLAMCSSGGCAAIGVVAMRPATTGTTPAAMYERTVTCITSPSMSMDPNPSKQTSLRTPRL